MEKIKILTLDHEVSVHGQLDFLFAALFNGSASLIFTETIESFKEEFTANRPWSIIIINFQVLDFLEMSPNHLSEFVADLRNSQQAQLEIIGATGSEYQKHILEKCGVKVLNKVYPFREIAILLGFSDNKKKEEITIEFIQKEVCNYYNIPYQQLLEKTRKREVVQARQITMYLAKSFTKNSLKTIGEHFGGRDHTTVIHSCQTVKDLMDTDSIFKENVIELQNKLAVTKLQPTG